jgi:hypothetical protein
MESLCHVSGAPTMIDGRWREAERLINAQRGELKTAGTLLADAAAMQVLAERNLLQDLISNAPGTADRANALQRLARNDDFFNRPSSIRLRYNPRAPSSLATW